MNRVVQAATPAGPLTADDIDHLMHRLPAFRNQTPDVNVCVVRPGHVTLTNGATAHAGQITHHTTAVCLVIDTGGGNWTLSWLDVASNQAVLYDFLWEADDEDERANRRAIGRDPGPRRQARHSAIKNALKEFVAGTPADTRRGGFLMTACHHEGVTTARHTGMWCVMAYHGILLAGADISRMWAQGDNTDELMEWWGMILAGIEDGDDIE